MGVEQNRQAQYLFDAYLSVIFSSNPATCVELCSSTPNLALNSRKVLAPNDTHVLKLLNTEKHHNTEKQNEEMVVDWRSLW